MKLLKNEKKDLMRKMMSKTETVEMVNHPSHYNSVGIEPIVFIANMTFCAGNIYKYLLRAPFKGKPLEDLKKALFYCEYCMDNNIPVVGYGINDYIEIERPSQELLSCLKHTVTSYEKASVKLISDTKNSKKFSTINQNYIACLKISCDVYDYDNGWDYENLYSELKTLVETLEKKYA